MKTTSDSLLLFYDIKKLEDSTVKELMNGGFLRIKRMTTLMIDPEDDVSFDKKKVTKKIEQYFPKLNDTAYLVINWERKMFYDLKKGDKKNYKIALEEFIELLKFIKNLRPNILVGVYGIPFRQNTIRNPYSFYSTEKILPILEHADFIAPSLYILYSNNEIDKKDYYTYFQTNLQRALVIGKELEKKVIPYIGYRIYSRHSTSSWSLIPSNEFKSYIEFLMKYSYDGKAIAGIIIWNGDFNDYRMSRNSYRNSKISQLEFLYEYNSKALNYCKNVELLVNE